VARYYINNVPLPYTCTSRLAVLQNMDLEAGSMTTSLSPFRLWPFHGMECVENTEQLAMYVLTIVHV